MFEVALDYLQAIESMSPEVYRRLLRAVELGRWPDGSSLSPAQRESALQAVIAWGERHLPERERVGFIDRGHKATEHCDDPGSQDASPLTWRE